MPIIYNKKSEIRKDYFLERYVIITPSRSKRPRDVVESTHRQPGSSCVLCPENIEKDLITDNIGGKKNWRVLTIKNKYPAVALNNPKAYGYQEVIIDTREHSRSWGEMNEKEILDILKMYGERTKKIGKIKNIDYILIFKNNGGQAGASLLHEHSQIFATKKIPPDVFEELDKAQEYKIKHGTCIYEEIIKKEKKSARHIWHDKNIIAFCPFASMYHHEAWIFPFRHLDNIARLNKNELKSLAKALKLIITKLEKHQISYNFFMHQSVSHQDQHFYIKIQPRESIWAGVELGSGMVINSIPPEKAAKFYRSN